MSYVDGFLLPVPTDNIDAYKELAEKAGKIWIEHGALDYKECMADDMVQSELASFVNVIGAKENETVFFSFIVFKSREHRDEVNAKVMSDERLACDDKKMPFEVKRMAYGGFKTLVEATAKN